MKNLTIVLLLLLTSAPLLASSNDFDEVRRGLQSPEQVSEGVSSVGVDRSEFSSVLGAVNPHYSNNFDPSQLDANDRAIASELMQLKLYMAAQDDAWLNAAVREAASDNVVANGRVERYVGSVFDALPAALKSKISLTRQAYQGEDGVRLDQYFSDPSNDVLGVSPEIIKMSAEVERLIAYRSPVPPAFECRFDSSAGNPVYKVSLLEGGVKDDGEGTYLATWGSEASFTQVMTSGQPSSFSGVDNGYRYYSGVKQQEYQGPYAEWYIDYEICREAYVPDPEPEVPAIECLYDAEHYYSWYLDAMTGAGTSYVDAQWGSVSRRESGDTILPAEFERDGYRYYANTYKEKKGKYKWYEICREAVSP